MNRLPNNELLKRSSCLLAICLFTTISAEHVLAQNGYRTAASTYFGGGSSRQQPTTGRLAGPVSQTVNVAARGKPFQNVSRQPTISPYLSLGLVTDEGTALPNYYAFYKPQREQQQSVESQQAEIRKLRQQVRTARVNTELSRTSVQSMPTTGSSSQFMNLGNYYPGLR